MKNGSNETRPSAKRFYEAVATEASAKGWRILLDGRVVKTPKRAELQLPTAPLADAVAGEWRAQGLQIDPASMPLTKLSNTAIDAVTPNLAAVAEDVLNFAARDLICYRAKAPESLVERQSACWDPLLDWAEQHHGVRLITTEGIMPVDQPPESLAALAASVARLDSFALAALHVMTTLTGSAILALAHVADRLSLEECWAAAHVDEDYQIGHWGEDAEARRRRGLRFADMRAASEFFRLSRLVVRL
jgi:chaperone required for assembly of F1-ATPase